VGALKRDPDSTNVFTGGETQSQEKRRPLKSQEVTGGQSTLFGPLQARSAPGTPDPGAQGLIPETYPRGRNLQNRGEFTKSPQLPGVTIRARAAWKIQATLPEA